MAYDLNVINESIRHDIHSFIAECDATYYKHIEDAARRIAEMGSSIVLLAGPSSSGKTTTAGYIEYVLDHYYKECHLISMDDYYKDVNDVNYPRTEDGELDLESPFCLDIDLLNRHIELLERGEEIRIPRYNFAEHRRDPHYGRRLRRKEGEIVLFEGIHALNDMFTAAHPTACKAYVSAHSHIMKDGALFFERSWTRLMRRMVRDNNYRGSTAVETLHQWTNVRRGEQLYIAPFFEKADVVFNTSHGYEIPALAHYVLPMLKDLPRDVPNYDIVEKILAALPAFEPVDPALLNPNCLLRKEFIK